jgi:aminoglycoside 6'-N-acetyltransferase
VESGPSETPVTPGVLPGAVVRLRPVSPEDLPALLAILDEPEVARWWRRAEWERVDEKDAVTLVIELKTAGAIAGAGGAAVSAGGGAVAGCIQYSEETDPDYFSAAVDIFVGTAAQGRGVGLDAMRTLIAWLFDVRGHHRLTVDPAAENPRAIHVYEKLGFRPVGVLRRYERVEDGTWRDALLMELLAEEFRRA